MTKIPPRGPYLHLGIPKLANHDRRVHDDKAEKNGPRALGSPTGQARWGRILPREAILDYTPLFYAVHIWNEYVRSGQEPQ